MQSPINRDHALCFKTMFVDVLRKGIDLWRPSRIIGGVRFETRKISNSIMEVHTKNGGCQGKEKKRSKKAQISRGKLPVQWLGQKNKHKERQRENHRVMMRP